MALSTGSFDSILPIDDALNVMYLLQRYFRLARICEIVLLSIHHAQITIALIALIKCGLQICANEHARSKRRSNDDADYPVFARNR